MGKSLFSSFIKKGALEKVSTKYYEIIAEGQEKPNYLHDEVLTKEYSLDMTFDSISGNYTKVTADVVSFDSPVPLKKRNSIASASGEIPKLATGRTLNEKQMNKLNIMSQVKGRSKQFFQELFADVKHCTVGVKESLDQILYTSLSSGVALVQDDKNVGHGIRFDYGIKDENKFGALWSQEDAKPMDDIKRIVKASRNAVKVIWMDSYTVDKMCANAQVRSMFGFGQNIVGADVPVLSEEQLRQVLKTQSKLTLRVQDRTFVNEVDGVQTPVEGWSENMVVFTPSENVGTLVYGTVAEDVFRQEGVQYSKPNEYILISKSGETNPVSELTAAQAIVMPVLQDVDRFFYLDTEEGETVNAAEIEGDANITVFGGSQDKATVIAAMEAIKKSVSADITDEDLITAINALSNAKEAALKSELGI